MKRASTVRRDRPRSREHGQILVLFTLAVVAIVAMVGLILDGGSVYAQRRGQQNAADLAALAGANDYMINNDNTSAIARARSIATANGYTAGTNNVTVDVSIDTSNGVAVTVNIGAQHRNSFASVVGQNTWGVAVTATALAGFPDTAQGAAPFILSIDDFDSAGNPLPLYGDSAHPYSFGDGNGDVPNDPNDLAWTNYGTGNLNTNEVRQIIDGSLVINKTIQFGEYIGQHNNGNHTALFSDVDQYLSGTDVVIPIVDHNGYFQGWATFHVVSADGGSSKTITGYFVSKFVNAKLTVGNCSGSSCPRYLGTYVLKLVN